MKKGEFFFKKGPFALNELLRSIDFINLLPDEKKNDHKIYGIQTID